jgi:hypothetical protein
MALKWIVALGTMALGRALEVSDPVFVVGKGMDTGLPPYVADQLMASNNNLDMTIAEGRFFMSFRTAPTHFASEKTKVFVVSAEMEDPEAVPNSGWELEAEFAIGSDLREPHFMYLNGTMTFSYFQAGTDWYRFEPVAMWRCQRLAFGEWTVPEIWGADGEIPWAIQVHGDRAYMTSYNGNAYQLDEPDIDIHFNVTSNGIDWEPVDLERPAVYNGGVSEVGWTFDQNGNFWGVMRNEQGSPSSGFGSLVAFADANDLGNWEVPEKSNREIFMSPKMFSHGDDVYLVGRKDPNREYDWGPEYDDLPFAVRRTMFLTSYSFRSHTTSLYRINKVTREIEFVRDLFGCGDTAFPSIVQLGPHKFIVFNYSSPLEHPDWSWIRGQSSPEGTQIHYVILDFSEEASEQ